MLPCWYIDIRNCIEVFEQVISLNIGSSQCWAQESQPQVGEGEEVFQILHDLHTGVQGVHVDQLWTCEHSKPSAHLKYNNFIFLLVKHSDQINSLIPQILINASMMYQCCHDHDNLDLKLDCSNRKINTYLCPNPARVLLSTDDPS